MRSDTALYNRMHIAICYLSHALTVVAQINGSSSQTASPFNLRQLRFHMINPGILIGIYMSRRLLLLQSAFLV